MIASKPELRWFWSITVYVTPKHGIITRGRAPSLEETKAQFLAGSAEFQRRIRLRPRALLPKPAMSSLPPRTLPTGFIAPYLPTRAPQPPSGAICLHEIKHDGLGS